MSAPVIRTDRLILKPMCTKYLNSTHAYASDVENCRLMLFLPNESLEDTFEYLKDAETEAAKDNPSYYELAVFLGEIHIGAVSLYISDKRDSAEIGWVFHRQYHGHGYASEAAVGLLKFAADELEISSFIAHCDSENIASRRVMEKIGMKLAGEYGGRRNKMSSEERRECMYVLTIQK